MAKKDTDMKEYKLKGQITSIKDDGTVKVEIVKKNSVDEDQENIKDMSEEFFDFCKKYEGKKETIEMDCSIKAIKE